MSLAMFLPYALLALATVISADSNCENGGVWERNGCKCPDPYVGQRCETLHKCVHGTFDRSYYQKCLCEEGFAGPNCAGLLNTNKSYIVDWFEFKRITLEDPRSILPVQTTMDVFNSYQTFKSDDGSALEIIVETVGYVLGCDKPFYRNSLVYLNGDDLLCIPTDQKIFRTEGGQFQLDAHLQNSHNSALSVVVQVRKVPKDEQCMNGGIQLSGECFCAPGYGGRYCGVPLSTKKRVFMLQKNATSPYSGIPLSFYTLMLTDPRHDDSTSDTWFTTELDIQLEDGAPFELFLILIQTHSFPDNTTVFPGILTINDKPIEVDAGMTQRPTQGTRLNLRVLFPDVEKRVNIEYYARKVTK